MNRDHMLGYMPPLDDAHLEPLRRGWLIPRNIPVSPAMLAAGAECARRQAARDFETGDHQPDGTVLPVGERAIDRVAPGCTVTGRIDRIDRIDRDITSPSESVPSKAAELARLEMVNRDRQDKMEAMEREHAAKIQRVKQEAMAAVPAWPFPQTPGELLRNEQYRNQQLAMLKQDREGDIMEMYR